MVDKTGKPTPTNAASSGVTLERNLTKRLMKRSVHQLVSTVRVAEFENGVQFASAARISRWNLCKPDSEYQSSRSSTT